MALKASIDLRSGVNRFASPPQIPDNPSNYGRVPDIGGGGGGGGVMSMDNPEYILDSREAIHGGRGRSGRGNYDLNFPPNSNSGNNHTLGIPLVNNSSLPSHSSSQGPSSIQSAWPAAVAGGPYSSITSTGSGGHVINAYGLNGAINGGGTARLDRGGALQRRVRRRGAVVHEGDAEGVVIPGV